MKRKALLSFILAAMATMWAGTTQAQEYYDLTIALTQVNSINCKNLSFIKGVSGTVKYDDETKTLTLENATIVGDKYKTAISSKINGLIIKVIGKNKLQTESGSGILYENSITITGDGTLDIECQKNCAIYANKGNLTIEDCTINAKSNEYGIAGYNGTTENLTIKNAAITAEGTEKGSICDFATLTTSKVVIVKDATSIEAPTVNATAAQGVYTLSGVRVSNELKDLPKGIYIVNGKKVVKR